MPFDNPTSPRRRIAVVGAGISGLATAMLLAKENDVVLHEAEPRLGGHARTISAGLDGNRAVDTGFIVFNYINYPHLTSMFQKLDVQVEKSNMCFGVTIDDGRLEYGLRNPAALFAQRRNLVHPGFLGMVRDIFRFNSNAEAVARNGGMTIDELVEELGLGRWFRECYLRPIGSAIWSTGTSRIGEFPAETLVRFFRNHALLGVSGQHQWWTVKGGSREYVNRLAKHLMGLGVQIRTSAPVKKVLRFGDHVRVVGSQGPEAYDQVVLACHSDQSLRLLERPTSAEQATLSNIHFQNNDAVLHRDPGMMPRRRACWSSWVYQSSSGQDGQKVSITYWMNLLQNIPESDPLFVTLNPVRPIKDEAVYNRTVFRHPVYDRATLAAQARISDIQGKNRTWFAGAWTRNGFHEDGFASATRIARSLTGMTLVHGATE